MTADTAADPVVTIKSFREDYVAERVRLCREILAAGVKSLQPPKADPYQPLRPSLPGEPPRWCEVFAGWIRTR